MDIAYLFCELLPFDGLIIFWQRQPCALIFEETLESSLRAPKRAAADSEEILFAD